MLVSNPKARVLLDALAEVPDAITLIEMGCLRHPEENSIYGYSTLYLALEAKKRGTTLHSIDLDPEAVEAARRVVGENGLSPWVNHINGDAIGFLETFPFRIDFLYLDGPNQPGLTLAAFKAAEPKFAENAIVVIDDCHWRIFDPFNPLGKGSSTIRHAKKRGWDVEIVPTINAQRSAVLRRAD